jgi:hypothetical protein
MSFLAHPVLELAVSRRRAVRTADVYANISHREEAVGCYVYVNI